MVTFIGQDESEPKVCSVFNIARQQSKAFYFYYVLGDN